MGIPKEELTIDKKPDRLLKGTTVPNLVKTEKLAAGTWKRGMVIGKKSDGTFGVIGDTGFDETNIHAIVLETKILAADGLIQVYFSGEFEKTALIVANSFDIEKLITPARKLNMIID